MAVQEDYKLSILHYTVSSRVPKAMPHMCLTGRAVPAAFCLVLQYAYASALQLCVIAWPAHKPGKCELQQMNAQHFFKKVLYTKTHIRVTQSDYMIGNEAVGHE